ADVAETSESLLSRPVGADRQDTLMRAFRFCGLLLLNLAVAFFGTGILGAIVGAVIPTPSFNAVLWKLWILSILCAGFIGFGMWWKWRSPATKWTWVLPSLWFAFPFFLAVIRVLPPHRDLLSQFSGTGCRGGVDGVGCRAFFVYTIPFIRG